MTAQYATARTAGLLTRRVAAAARPVIGTTAARMLARTPLAGPLRRALGGATDAGPQIVTVCGGSLRGMRLSVDLAREKYYWLGTHEPRVQDALKSIVRPADIVYDIGSHVGFFALSASTQVGPMGRVIAFEALESNLHRLRAGVAANRITNIDSHALAISDHVGEERFAIHDSSLEGLLLDDAAVPATHESAVTVQVSTLDALVGAGMAAPDVIKIDVEGVEGRVIAGARETLADHKPALLVEIHSQEAGVAVVDALPVPYLFEDIHTRCSVTRALVPGHYLARAR